MRQKLTGVQIEEIKTLKLPQNQIAQNFNVSQNCVSYYLNPNAKEKNKKYKREWYKRLSLKERRRIRKNYLEYQKNYHRNKYQNDPVFKSKCLQRSKEYKLKVKSRH